MLAYVYAAAGVSVWLEDGGGICWGCVGCVTIELG